MSETSADAVQLIAGLVTHMKQIVGDGACYAMLHYGAMEEGKRFGATTQDQDLGRILARIDQILGQRSEVIADSGAEVRIRIHSSPLADTGQRALHGVILGLVEGSLTSTRRARYKGTVTPGSEKGELLLELKREG
jgi:hypothetical protein